MQASGLCRILNARCATAPALCGSWTTSVGSKRHSPGSGIVSKRVRAYVLAQARPVASLSDGIADSLSA